MKKALFIALAACGMYAADAQIIKVPKGPHPKIPKNLIVTKPSVVGNRTMGNYPKVTMRVVVSIEDAGEQGYKVNFQSSIPLERVETTRSEPKQVMITRYLEAGQSSGYFFMDSPAYIGSNTYLLTFYAPGYPKGMWTSMIQRKKS